MILERLGSSAASSAFSTAVMFVFIALGVAAADDAPILARLDAAGDGRQAVAAVVHGSWLPILFVISAIGMGYAVVMFEAHGRRQTFSTARPSTALICSFPMVVGWITVGWLVIALGRSARPRCRGVSPSRATLSALMFWIENALFVGAALGVLDGVPAAPARAPRSLGAVALLAGGSLYRIDAYLVGYDAGPETGTTSRRCPRSMVTSASSRSRSCSISSSSRYFPCCMAEHRRAHAERRLP